MNDNEQDVVLQALAHQVRRAILRHVRTQPGCNVQAVASQFALSRIAILKHITVLENASLIVSERVGRERLLYFNLVPIQALHAEWADQISAHMAASLLRLKQRVEQQDFSGGTSHEQDHENHLSSPDTRQHASGLAGTHETR
jgi:DNA-binding transcriptional ArsR family regulator